jgi:hypothetical protein
MPFLMHNAQCIMHNWAGAVLMHNAQCIMHNWASAIGRNVCGIRNLWCVTCRGVSHTPE